MSLLDVVADDCKNVVGAEFNINMYSFHQIRVLCLCFGLISVRSIQQIVVG